MPLYKFVPLLLLLLSGVAQAANHYPVVLVHGFLGFGPDKFQDSGFQYWGGYHDIAAHLQTYHGAHQVAAASVGPVSSNWDRAAELYYQIKGGCVDYGRRHTAHYAQFGAQQKPPGKCWATDPANNPEHYPLALYPAWDANHPIHLIGHSQGGPTIRAMTELLENGSPNGDEGGGALYTGGKIGWVFSITSIASTHNGTTLRDAALDFVPKLSEWSGQVARIAGIPGAAPPSFGLEHFGSGQPFWKTENHDAAQWELGPDGAREFNAWARTSPNIYHFSLATAATEAGSDCCNDTDRLIAPIQNAAFQYPRADMSAFFKPYAGEWIVPSLAQRGIGSYTQSAPGRVPIDSAWFRNDGVVNTVSMRAPFGHPSRNYDGTSLRGTWNFLGTYQGYDHFDILGWPNQGPSALPVYERIADILFCL